MKTQVSEESIKKIFFRYFIVSLFLSTTIVLRLTVTDFTPDLLSFYKIVGYANIVFYFLYFYIMPTYILLFLFNPLDRSSKEKSEWKQVLKEFILIFSILIILFALLIIDLVINSTFFYFMPISIVILALFFKYWKGLLNNQSFSKKLTIAILLSIILMPLTSAFLGYHYTSTNLDEQDGNYEKINFISSYVMDAHTSIWGPGSIFYSFLRFDDDFLKFLLVGVGGCRDVALLTAMFLDSVDLDTRPVSFNGEDHMFVEVFWEDNWWVVDPGYNMTLVTQTKRGEERLKEMGGLSFVAANSDTNPIDLTKDYVQTDEIIINVLNNGEPVENATVILEHTFNGLSLRLPPFKSDNNGIVVVNLGPMGYSNQYIEPAEPYYWIVVDGIETILSVNSSGSGKSVLIEVDIANYQ